MNSRKSIMNKGVQIVVVVVYLATFLLVAGIAALAVHGAFASNQPQVTIDAPANHSQFRAGDQVAVQSTSTDSAGITQVRLSVDGKPIRTDVAPSPQQSFKVIQSWKAIAGDHTISVQAINQENQSSDPTSISVSVLPIGAPAPTTSGPVPGTACTNDSAFVTDVTVNDGTFFVPGQAFSKVWRVQNNGTCVWGNGYELVFEGGSRLDAPGATDVPMTPAGRSADLKVTMKAPGQAGEYTGHWQLRSPGGETFGAVLDVTIQVGGSRGKGCVGNPVIASFSANPTTILLGQSSTLEWGMVRNADHAQIDPDIGGIATPGSQSVSPKSTTIYTLTARCGSQTTTAQTTITVSP